MTFYMFAKRAVWQLLNPIYRFEIIGLEHFPKDGGVLLCSNHINNLDPPVVGITAPRPIIFMAKEELFKSPFMKKLMIKLNVFPVKRGKNDREALRMALSVLKENQVLGVFPEGTRSKTGELGKGMAGAGFFALRTKANVVPCAIIGPYKPFKRLKVVYGQPIDMDPLRQNKKSAEEATEVIMNEIRKLMEKHRS